MTRCIQLARLGFANTRPNPMVGSVIVHRDVIIGEGYHRRAGEPHAEINALANVTDKSLLKDSTLYVNLEPCSHYGKTPPCSNAIIGNGIRRVVIGTPDSNQLVSGNGIRRLREAGVEVEVGILADSCRELNRRFFTWHEKKRPYIILKWAQTQDGFLDARRKTPDSPPMQISSAEAMAISHQWRTEEDAIMVGTNTAFLDNPRLSARLVEGPQPIRIVLDRQLRLPCNLHLFDHSQRTLLINSSIDKMEVNLEWIRVDFSNLLEDLSVVLYNKGIQSLLVEGGATLLQSFLEVSLWDEIRLIQSEGKAGSGISAPKPGGKLVSSQLAGPDQIRIFRKDLSDR